MFHGCRAHARAVSFIVVAFALTSLPLAAQTVTGTMRGNITDRTGAALPGVTITIRNVETGFERVVVSGKDGSYNAPFLQVGRYNVAAELSGFGTMRHENVRVDLNQTVVQDFVLNPAVAETVTVNADTPRIDVTDGEIKQTMRGKEIMALPQVDQANFTRLASTFSGYEENPTSGQDNPALSSGSSVNFNGAGTRGATFQINGVNNDDSSENQHRQNVPLATIQSFQVLTNSFSAEFGRGYGAVVLVQTKQGTNELQGELYGYAQDNKYNARDALQTSLVHGNHTRRQFGATAGFPIIRDKLFVFVNDHNVQDRGETTVTRGVFLPSDLDPTKRLTLGNDTPENRAWQDSIIARFPKGPPNAPDQGLRAYQGIQNQNYPDTDYSGRADYNATLSNTFTARYQKSHQIRDPGEFIIGEAANQDNHESNFGATWTNILSPNTVQEARAGIGLRAVSWTVSGGNSTPVVRIVTTSTPGFTILGNAGAFPIIRNQRDNQLVYNITTNHWEHHTFKAGVDVRKSELDDRADNFNRGYWRFTPSCGGVNYGTGIAAFWAGCINTFTVAYGPNSLKNSMHEENAYAQDDWRPFDSLVLNLGVRFEDVSAPKEKNNLVDYQYKASSYIDPRLGFAYTPDWGSNRFLRALSGGNGEFSIRGGFGVYHGRVFQSIFSQGGANVRYNPPDAASLQFFSSTNLVNPTNGFVFTPGTWPATRVSLTTIDPNLKMPETRQWNLTFERQAFWNSRFRLSYIGTRGSNLLMYLPTNLPVAAAPPGTSGAAWVVAQDWQCAGTGTTVDGTLIKPTTACPNTVPLAANEVSLRAPRYNSRRPNSCCTTNLTVANLARSWYNAAQLEWETGEYRGLQGRATYTFAKAIDTGSEATYVGTGDTNVMIPDETYRKGPSRFDTRHRVTVAASYAFPFWKNRSDLLGNIVGGWTFSASMRYATGTPFTIVDSAAPDIFFNSLGAGRPVCVDPNWCSGTISSRFGATPPASAFRNPQYGDTYAGLVGRNSYYGPSTRDVDLGLYKSFGMTKNLTLMVRLDVFNVFNSVSWWFPDNDVASTTFGKFNQTSWAAAGVNPPRVMQLGLRVLY